MPNAAARGDELHQGLLGLKEKHDLIADVRGGHGLMNALEVVSDRRAKSPIDKKTIGRVFQATYDNGVMVRVSGPNIICPHPWC